LPCTEGNEVVFSRISISLSNECKMRKTSIARPSISGVINRRHVTKGGVIRVINVLIQVDQYNSSIIDSLAVSTSPNELSTGRRLISHPRLFLVWRGLGPTTSQQSHVRTFQWLQLGYFEKQSPNQEKLEASAGALKHKNIFLSFSLPTIGTLTQHIRIFQSKKPHETAHVIRKQVVPYLMYLSLNFKFRPVTRWRRSMSEVPCLKI